MVINYKGANIYFPKYQESNPKEFRIPIPRWGWGGCIDNLLFVRNGFAISADFSEPEESEIKTTNLINAINFVAKDFVPAENLFGELERLAREEITGDSLHYKRMGPSDFRVYDFSSKKYPDVLTNMLLIAEADERILVPEYQELRKFAVYIGRPDQIDSRAHIKGKTLKEAIERALIVYRNAPKVSPLGESVEKALKIFQEK